MTTPITIWLKSEGRLVATLWRYVSESELDKIRQVQKEKRLGFGNKVSFTSGDLGGSSVNPIDHDPIFTIPTIFNLSLHIALEGFLRVL